MAAGIAAAVQVSDVTVHKAHEARAARRRRSQPPIATVLYYHFFLHTYCYILCNLMNLFLYNNHLFDIVDCAPFNVYIYPGAFDALYVAPNL